MSAHYRPAVPSDVQEVALRMRELDIREVGAHGMGPLEALEKSFKLSDEVNAIIIEGVPEALFGVSGNSVWLLCTDKIKKIGKQLIREGREWLDAKNEEIGVLENYVLASHHEAIFFIQVLGGTLTHEVQLQGSDETFFRFERSTH